MQEYGWIQLGDEGGCREDFLLLSSVPRPLFPWVLNDLPPPQLPVELLHNVYLAFLIELPANILEWTQYQDVSNLDALNCTRSKFEAFCVLPPFPAHPGLSYFVYYTCEPSTSQYMFANPDWMAKEAVERFSHPFLHPLLHPQICTSDRFKRFTDTGTLSGASIYRPSRVLYWDLW